MRSSPTRSPFEDERRPWLEMLAAVGPSPDGLKLPARSDLDAVLGRLRVDERDAYEIRAFWPSPPSDPDLWWLLERASRALVNDLGGYRSLGWPSLPAAFGGTGRYFWVYVYLSVLPA